MRRLALAVALPALAASIGLVARWLDGGRPSAAACVPVRATPGATPAERSPAELPRAPQDPRRVPPPDAGARPDAARACPDLGSLLAEHASRLGGENLSFERDWVPASTALADELDRHCCESLVRMGAEPWRAAEQRLAALSIVAAGEPFPGDWSLEPLSRSWLWAQAESAAGESSTDASGEPQPADRGHTAARTAGVAAFCLVRLGDARTRRQLAEHLRSSRFRSAAVAGLEFARERDVVAPVLAVLEEAGPGELEAAALLVHWSTHGAFGLAGDERERAVAALLTRWRGGAGTDQGAAWARGRGAFALQALAPDVAAGEWRRRLDGGALDSRERSLAVEAIAGRADPEDLDRLHGLLQAPGSWDRYEAAKAVLESPSDGAAGARLDEASERVLCDLARRGEQPELRSIALERARVHCAGFGELALEVLARDPDAGVRLKAVVGLGRDLAGDPRVGAALAGAAAADCDGRVREAAQRALRRGAAGRPGPHGN